MRLFHCLAPLALALLGTGGAVAAPSLERGDYLVNSIMACGSCHTPQGPEGPLANMGLGGQFLEETEAFTAVAPNITPASRIHEWSDAELMRAIREGIRPDGSVIGPPMPFEVYKAISDDDLASVVMYLRTVPAVENDPGVSEYRMPLPPAYGPPVESVAAVPDGVTVEYGAYLAGPLGHCIVCHSPIGPQGADIEGQLGVGGNEFHGPWGVSISPNITPVGLANYSDAEIETMITQGVRPDGSRMLPPMSYPHYARMTGNDVDAIVLYLRALPPKS